MQKTPTIRIAALSDKGTLLEFEQALIEAERPHALMLKDGSICYYDLDHFIADKHTHLLLVDIEGRPVACGYVQIRDSQAHHNSKQHGYLGFMYVCPEWRGNGINKLLMQELQSWALTRGVHHFRLDVFITNQAAIRAYEKVGFQANMVEMVLEL